jgi:gliding motility-associated-like protein
VKKYSYFILPFLVLIFCHEGRSQVFLNSELNGETITSPSKLPYNWQNVPFDDPVCGAIIPGFATPDLTGITGPSDSIGLIGNPHSAPMFVSGVRSTMFQEGIMQTVSGFTIGENYTIEFYQSVVKQINCPDTSGSWNVFVDSNSIGITIPTVSHAHYASTSFDWELRSVSFIATDSMHTIKFLPEDDDLNLYGGVLDLNGKIRMGIEDITLLCSHELNLGNDTVLCQGETLNLDATTVNGEYLWQDNSEDPQYDITQPGTYTIDVSVYGCIVSDTITVSVNTILDIDFEKDTTLCEGELLTLDITNPNSTYTWQDGSASTHLTIDQAGVYWGEVTNFCGSFSDTIEVFYNPLPIINLGNDTVLCQGENITLNSFTAGGNYLWQNSSTNATFNVTQQGSYRLTTTVNDCSSSDTINVEFDQVPVLLGSDTSLCPGESIDISLFNQNTLYLWQDNTTDSIHFIDQAGLYWVNAVNQCGVFKDSIQVVSHPNPVVKLGLDTLLCMGDSISLDVTQPNYTYVWQDGSTDSRFTILQAGTYYVDVSSKGCSSSDNVNVSAVAPISLDLGSDTLLCFSEELTLNVTQPNSIYLWQDGATQSYYTINDSGLYHVLVTNVCGVLMDSIDVTQKDCESKIIMPTIFTPNGDGKNDLFLPVFSNSILSYQLKVYNRWGQEIFTSDQISHGWNGTINSGTTVPRGTYFWLVHITNNNGFNETLKGHVSLLRD